MPRPFRASCWVYLPIFISAGRGCPRLSCPPPLPELGSDIFLNSSSAFLPTRSDKYCRRERPEGSGQEQLPAWNLSSYLLFSFILRSGSHGTLRLIDRQARLR